MLKDTYRTSDIIARIGGDEFALLAVDAAESDAALLRERMYEAIGSYNARTGCEYSISISLGIACFDPQRPRTIDELLSEADRLMYRQKKEMRGKKS